MLAIRFDLMSISNKENFQIFLLQEYHRRGLAGRLGLAHLAIEQIMKIQKNPPPDPSDDKFGLNYKEKLCLLQFAAIAYLMMVIEDIALFCNSFLKNDPEYYQHLDRKEEDDLGDLISMFYSKIDSLTNDEVRQILSIVHPNEFELKTDEDKNTLISALNKNINLMRVFLAKTRVFYESHIAIFRRFKHAGFPIMFGNDIPHEDDLFDKFDLITFAFTSRKDIVESLTALPFSKKAIQSYLTFLLDIYQVMYTIINSRLIVIQRNIKGVLPRSDDFFSQVLSEEEKEKLKQLSKEFEEKFPSPSETFHARIATKSRTAPWYKYLDSHYSKSVLELSKIVSK